MGCCGCSNKSSAVTAGIFGLIQGGIGLLCNIYFLNLYNTYIDDLTPEELDNRLFLLYVTRDAIVPLRFILWVATVLHSLWILSSIFLLIGNSTHRAGWVRQWVVITPFVIIGDIILPVVVVILTFGAVQDSIASIINKHQGDRNTDTSSFVENEIANATVNYYLYYIVFVMTFHKLGLITLITNICLTVFTNRRAAEMSNPRGYIMGPTVTIIHNQTLSPGLLQVGPNNPGYPVMIQQGIPSPLYGGNVPGNFGQGADAALPAYTDQEGSLSNPLRDDQKDRLLSQRDQQYCY